MAKTYVRPTSKRNFEFEARNGKFNLYERGGDHRLHWNAAASRLEGWVTPFSEFDMLLPVSQVEQGDNEDYQTSLEKAIRVYVDYHITKLSESTFEFEAKILRGKEPNFKGKVEPDSSKQNKQCRVTFS